MNNSNDNFFTKLQINDEKFKNKQIIEIFAKDKKTNNIIIELDHKDENTKIESSISEGKIISLYINDKSINFAQINNNINWYETFNVVSENGDSIYSPTGEELTTIEKCQVFISEYKLEEIVNRMIDQRLGSNY